MAHIRHFLLLISALCLFLAPVSARAEIQFPKPITSDPRIKTFVYDPNGVYVYTGYFKYASSIEFAPDEQINEIAMGDPTGWQTRSAANRLFLKPIDSNATTNMTVFTDRRIYYFELYAAEAEGIRDEGLSFVTRFVYPGDSSNDQGAFRQYMYGNKDEQPDYEDEPERYNFNYTLTGSRYVAPLKVFDDGEFTFMEFRDINADIPGIFMVNKYGDEMLVNYRMMGDFVVVERVGSLFTLRHGEDVACVFNEANPLDVPKKETKKDKKFLGLF